MSSGRSNSSSSSCYSSASINDKRARESFGFKMPLQYPRYKRSDYERMEEWKLDCLLAEYGLPVTGDVEEKRSFAMGTFLWN